MTVWSGYQRDGMGGVGHLPFAGGLAEQPSALMMAFEVMDWCAAKVREAFKPR